MRWSLVAMRWTGLLLATGATTLAFQVPVRRSNARVALTPLKAVISVDEQASREIGAFDEWATDCGVQRAAGVQLTSQDGEDFYLATSEPLQEGTPLLMVPEGMILSSTKARQEFGGDVQAAVDFLVRNGASEHHINLFYLFLKVLVEYEKGDQSPWFPWLNALPRLYYNAVSMTDFCIECLPPLVFSLGRKERVKFENCCKAIEKVDFISEETKEDIDALKWAFNVVSTRCWGPKNEKQIVPMADMFNHGTETEIMIQNDENGNCIAYATKDVPAGSPLRMSYGDPTNPSKLFATYGFLDETSPATFCKIMTIQPTPELKDLGLDFSRMLFFKDTGGISQEVYDVMLYKILDSNKEVQQAFYEAHMAGDADTKQAIHQQYFLQTATAIKNHVDTFLQSLEDLSKKTVGKDVSEHPRLPLILAHNEFVKNTFLNVKAQLDPMVEEASEPVYN